MLPKVRLMVEPGYGPGTRFTANSGDRIVIPPAYAPFADGIFARRRIGRSPRRHGAASSMLAAMGLTAQLRVVSHNSPAPSAGKAREIEGSLLARRVLNGRTPTDRRMLLGSAAEGTTR
jgi:hypothetical protein